MDPYRALGSLEEPPKSDRSHYPKYKPLIFPSPQYDSSNPDGEPLIQTPRFSTSQSNVMRTHSYVQSALRPQSQPAGPSPNLQYQTMPAPSSARMCRPGDHRAKHMLDMHNQTARRDADMQDCGDRSMIRLKMLDDTVPEDSRELASGSEEPGGVRS